MLYIIFAEDDPARTSIRDELAAAHAAYLKQFRERFVLGGAQLQEDGTTRTGSVFVLNMANLAEAQAFADDEPFNRAGLFARIRITRMRRGTWFPENAPASADGA
jgi:uncharacterized protein YciI